MSAVSLRLPDNLLSTVDAKASGLKISRNEYIRQAIILMNKKVILAERELRLKKASELVRMESMLVNNDFAEIENDPYT